jgi:hypothetical protein
MEPPLWDPKRALSARSSARVAIGRPVHTGGPASRVGVPG